MIRRRKLLLFTVITVLIFLITTNYLLLNLQKTDDIEVRKSPTIEEKIYQHLAKLPDYYNLRSPKDVSFSDLSLVNTKNSTVRLDDWHLQELWKEANSWVSKTSVINFSSPKMGPLLFALKNAKILKADLDSRGTQLKFLLTLQVIYLYLKNNLP